MNSSLVGVKKAGKHDVEFVGYISYVLKHGYYYSSQASSTRRIPALARVNSGCSEQWARGGDGDALDNNSIMVCDVCCCCHEGLFFGDGCMGCIASETLCCLEVEYCCKSSAPTLFCVCCAIRCVSPTVCIKSQGQTSCLAGVAAIPCDDEVPCMVGSCGIVC
ncbi:unnamed protein product [Prorocentrum cordatum]|uniref:Uncharacterized protein n=1 Tax=Prorocentrum cordatum TaxID=2364126 RepID=A0ABN9UWZ5_9DINO|nr:unnamed protein product [Polarella glacialis]